MGGGGRAKYKKNNRARENEKKFMHANESWKNIHAMA